jgi:hypothetical protein
MDKAGDFAGFTAVADWNPLIAAIVGWTRIILAFGSVPANPCREALDVIDRAYLRKVKERVGNDLSAVIKTKENVALNPLAVDPDEDGGIILFASLWIFGHEERTPIFSEYARFAISQTVDNHADAPAIFRTDFNAKDDVSLYFNVIPRAEKVARLAIIGVARLRFYGSGAQKKKH